MITARFAAVSALFAVILAACSSPPMPDRGETTPTSPATTPAVQHESRLTTSVISDPKTFNPILTVDQASSLAVLDLFDSLVRLDPRTNTMEPALAERWELNEDGTTCTFHLRKGVKWQDGQPLTSADVLFTFDAIYDDRVPNSIKHILLVDGQKIRIDAPDDYTVRLRLPRAFAPLLNSIAIPIVPKHILGESLKNGTFAQQWGIDTPPEKLVGSGPYQMVKYVPAQFIQYRRNPNYWMRDEAGGTLPYLEQRTVLIVPNQDTMYLKFLAGETDIHAPRPEEVTDLRARQDELAIRVQETGLDTGTLFVTFNRNPRAYEHDGARDPKLDWFTDKSFLRALAHAIDKQSIVTNCLYGLGQPAIGEISPENKLFHHPGLKDYPYDLTLARKLLEDSGYIDRDGDGIREDRAGHPIEINLNTNAGNQIREKICSILKEDWTKLGLQVNYRPLDFQLLVEKLNNTFDWDAILIGFTGSIEPHNAANLLKSNGNLHMWNPNQPRAATEWEAGIDRLVEAGSRELDIEKRRAIYWKIQEVLHEELPMLQTVRKIEFSTSRKLLKNFEPTAWGIARPERISIAE